MSRTYDFTKVSSQELQETVLESTLEFYTLESQLQSTENLTGMDLHWALINNECLGHEIKAIKNFISIVKYEIYQRVKIK